MHISPGDAKVLSSLIFGGLALLIHLGIVVFAIVAAWRLKLKGIWILAAPRCGFDQITKPDYIPPNNYYYYAGRLSDPAPWNHFFDSPILGGDGALVDIVTNLNNHYTIMAYAAEPRSTALGATPGVGNLTRSLNLITLWPSPDPLDNDYASHFYHSAEFRGDTVWEWKYWNTLLFSSQTGFNICNP